MALDGKVLARAREALGEKKRLHTLEYERRRWEVYSKNPRVRELDGELASTIADVIGLALSRGEDPVEAVEDIREENEYLQSERDREILAAGFPPGHLDEEYMCPDCRDTGFTRDGVCRCLLELYADEQRRALSLMRLGGESFDSFDLNWYDDLPDPASGVSPRRNMEFVYETCVQYARKFGKNSFNLALSGAPGLGKTFLSACIARVVSDKGYSVVYDTAPSVFSKFEDDKFNKTGDTGQLRGEIRRFLECELLILDDLGAEMTTAFTQAALYELVNTRLISGGKTVISTNLTPDDLYRRYTPQLVSRLEGEYQWLMFYGTDIRRLKKRL